MDKANEERLIAALDAQWHQQGGFLFDYKSGTFNENAYERLVSIIADIDLGGEELISIQLVALIYNIPFFLQRHKENVLRAGGSKMLCNYAINGFNSMLDRLFSSKSHMDWLMERASSAYEKGMFDFDD